MNCDFCKTSEVIDRIIIENELAFAFPTKTPIVPGHVLICPKRHIKYYEDATTEEKIAMELLRAKIKYALKKTFRAEGFNYAWNEETIGGQSVPHFHLHVTPRTPGDAGIYNYEPREFLYRPGPRTTTSPEEELLDIAQKLKSAALE